MQHGDEHRGLDLAADTHDCVIDRDLDRAGTNRGRLRRCRWRRICSRSISRCRAHAFMEQNPGLSTPPKQLLRAQPVASRHLRHADAGLEAIHHDAGLVLARPSTPAASARDQFDPPHVRDVATTSVRLAFKLTLKPNVKIIAHGSALRHNPDITDMWEGSPAYTTPA